MTPMTEATDMDYILVRGEFSPKAQGQLQDFKETGRQPVDAL